MIVGRAKQSRRRSDELLAIESLGRLVIVWFGEELGERFSWRGRHPPGYPVATLRQFIGELVGATKRAKRAGNSCGGGKWPNHRLRPNSSCLACRCSCLQLCSGKFTSLQNGSREVGIQKSCTHRVSIGKVGVAQQCAATNPRSSLASGRPSSNAASRLLHV